jgi:hypothetical protein
MAKKIKLVRVPGTTNNITKGIINYLNSRGHFAFRVNSGGVWDPTKKRFRAGRSAGVSDILCCLKGGPIFSGGRFLAIEVKNEATKDRIRPAQTAFKANVAAADGYYVTAASYDGFVSWFNSSFHGFI